MRILTLVALSVLPVLGQTSSDEPYRRMLESQREVTDYLTRAARELTDKAAAEVASKDAWEKVRAQRLDEMRDMLGLLPWPARTPLNVRVTGVLDKGSYTIEKIAFESLPKFYVTGNLYIPKQRTGRLPAIIYVCGHSYSPHGDKAQYQRHGISFAKNGYVAFILDSIQIAETYALHHGVQTQEMFDWYSRGYTPAGVEVWNAMRAIDYLETRSEVDRERIGMTGRSGGAAMSWFTAAVDPRVKVVAPVMGISTYAANLRENTQKLHCDCMFAINHHRHDMLHQGALIAPRPLLMAHGSKDRLFPVAGYEEFEKRIGALYTSYGANDGFGNVVVDSDHKDSDYLRTQAIRWFDKHLMKIPERKLDIDYSDAPGEQLAVFAGKPPADAMNHRIHETFTTRPASGRFADVSAWERRRSELLPAIQKLLPVSVEDGVPLRTEVFRPSKSEGRLPGLLYIASDGEDMAYIRGVLSGVNRRNESIRMVVWPRGIGEVPWPRSFWKDTLRNAMHLGETVDSMRLRDVLRAFERLRADSGVDPNRIMVLGKGVSGALGLYAAILEPRIHQVMLIDPPSTHREGPIFLNIMRHTDLSEAAALLAPRRLNFYGHMPPAFEYTKHVYELYGKPQHLFLAMNIEYVLTGRYDHGMASGL
jgi:cephalosporin-C deacetylase-like acetyl esterase